MYAADQAAATRGVPTASLMEAAGRAVAREIAKRWTKRAVVVLCGPGNNGGDGFVVARLLFNAGWPVRLALLGSVNALRGDAAVNARRWIGMGRAIRGFGDLEDLLAGQPLVVDALFGAGLARGLSGPAAAAVRLVNARGLSCVAIDIPSGVHGDSGAVLEDSAQPGKAGVAPACALTVTFFRPKYGHYLYPGRDLCGDVAVADIGIPDAVLEDIGPSAFRNGPQLWSVPMPDWTAHKHNRGHVVVFGSAEMTGAARLAGQGARRAGAGLLTYAVPARAASVYLADQPGAFVRGADAAADIDDVLADERKNVLVAGPGLPVTAAARALVLRLLGTNRAVVLDAGALTSFAGDAALLMEAIRSRTAPTVLTPHEGEFGRLFSQPGSKVERARHAAAISAAVVLLKGPDTIVAAPDGRVTLNPVAAPWLASGGSGDVLAGVIAGLIAQGMPAWHAASAAAWLHASAAARLGPALIAEDLPLAVAQEIKNIYNQ